MKGLVISTIAVVVAFGASGTAVAQSGAACRLSAFVQGQEQRRHVRGLVHARFPFETSTPR
jgi:hypothetical protein